MPRCADCDQELPPDSRFCIGCGRPLFASAGPSPDERQPEEMNMTALYVMVACLGLAGLVPPWETPPGASPEFLGFHFFLSPPEVPGAGTGIISRGLLTIELMTIATAGFYISWLLRSRPKAEPHGRSGPQDPDPRPPRPES
jgi:hypothetical protein